MKLLKSVGTRAIALIIFFAMISAVILYQAGAYDISFIKRPEAETSAGASSEITTEDDIIVLPPMPEDEMQQLLSSIKDFSSLEGYRVSFNKYSEKSLLVRLNSSVTADKIFSKNQYSKNTKLVYSLSSGRLSVKTISETIDRPVVSLYFGFVLIDKGNVFDVYTNNGKLIAEKLSLSLVNALTSDGDPVIKKDGKFFALTDEGLIEVASSEIRYKGISFDHPRYYGQSSIKLYPFSAQVEEIEHVGNVPTTKPQTEKPATTEKETEVATTEKEPSQSTETTESTAESSSESESQTEITGSVNLTSASLEGRNVTSEVTSETQTTVPETDSNGTETTNRETSEPETSESETTIPETGQTETTVTESTAPPTTEPETTKPETTKPETTKPETTKPETTKPEPTDTVIENGTFVSDGKYYKINIVTRYGYKDDKGKVVISPKYKYAYDFSNDGLAAVVDTSGRLYFINKNGKEVVSVRSKSLIRVEEFNNDIYRQSFRAPLNADIRDLGMYYFDSGYVMVRYCLHGYRYQDYLYKNENRLYDKNNNRIKIPGNYSLENYSEGIMLLEKLGQYGYMRPDLSWVSPAIYDYAQPFVQGLAVVGSDGKYGMIDTEGNTVLPMCFDYISNVSSGVIAAYTAEDGWQTFAIAEKLPVSQ